jgi:hypothetical protein
VTANLNAAKFYERLGFGFERSVETGFGPAPRMGINF